MPSGDIGETLREARERRDVTIEAVAERTRIQPRQLRALEDEDWDALPGEYYAARFLNTYAQYLGLDGGALVDQLRRGQEPPGRRGREPRVEPAPPGRARGGRVGSSSGSAAARGSGRGGLGSRSGRGTGPARAKGGLGPGARRAAGGGGFSMRAVGAALILAAIVIGFIIVVSGSGSSHKDGTTSPSSSAPAGAGQGKAQKAGGKSGSTGGKGGAAAGGGSKAGTSAKLTLKTTAEVWVCLLNAKGNALVDGQVLPSGETVGPFHSAGFTVALGNGSVAMRVNGKPEKLPPSSDPVGFKVGRHGGLTELSEGERPTCS